MMKFALVSLVLLLVPNVATGMFQSCNSERQSAMNRGPMPGLFIPECDRHGDYVPLQCHGSTGQCWCVDKYGEEIDMTRSMPGEQPTNCAARRENREPTACERQRGNGTPWPGAFVPECDYYGNFEPLQCDGSNNQCWCVDVNGFEKWFTRKHNGEIPDCGQEKTTTTTWAPPKSACEMERDNAGSWPGAFIPDCDHRGDFESQQCHASSGECWCVDTETGKEKSDTRTTTGWTLNCDHPPTKCEQQRKTAKLRNRKQVPKCDGNGNFLKMQCDGDYHGTCWCVDTNGRKQRDTQSFPGGPPPVCW